jgi:hypothetical protein
MAMRIVAPLVAGLTDRFVPPLIGLRKPLWNGAFRHDETDTLIPANWVQIRSIDAGARARPTPARILEGGKPQPSPRGAYRGWRHPAGVLALPSYSL